MLDKGESQINFFMHNVGTGFDLEHKHVYKQLFARMPYVLFRMFERGIREISMDSFHVLFNSVSNLYTDGYLTGATGLFYKHFKKVQLIPLGDNKGFEVVFKGAMSALKINSDALSSVTVIDRLQDDGMIERLEEIRFSQETRFIYRYLDSYKDTFEFYGVKVKAKLNESDGKSENGDSLLD